VTGLLHIRGLLLDMDGVIMMSWRPLPGAVEALARLRSAGLPLRLVTNTTEKTGAEMATELRGIGFDVADGEVLTAAAAAAAYLREHHRGARVHLVGDGRPHDLEGIDLVGLDEAPDVILLSGADQSFTFGTFNRVYRALLGGAALVAMHRNLAWMTEGGACLDAGAYLYGLERALGREAVVAGKPSPGAFAAGLRALGVPAAAALMVGDDVENDVLAAQAVGITGVLVRTGKFREESLAGASVAPDHVIGSIGELPGLLGLD
jgi:HAD superfamily hydrolase (TIGR01458 family)